MEETYKDQCKQFIDGPLVTSGGMQGGFSACKKGCPVGFTTIGNCGRPSNVNDRCGTHCSINPTPGSCSTTVSPGADLKQICKRNLDTFKPFKDKNLREQCCSLPIEQKTLRDQRDCPFEYRQITKAGGVKDETEICKSELGVKCLDPDKPDAVIGDGCEALGLSSSSTRDVYNSAMKAYCMQDLDHLNKTACAKWCNDNPLVCERTEITKMCLDLDNDVYNKNAKVCGCFLDPNVYKNVGDAIAKSYNVPPALLSGARKCYFPDCATATIEEYPRKTCPALNLTNCIQKIDIDARGAVLGPIQLKAENNCGNLKKEECNPKCKYDEDCVSGQCEPDTCKAKDVKCDYPKQQCVSGACVSAPVDDEKDDDDDDKKKKGLSGGAIAGIVIAVLFVLGLIGYFAYAQSKRTL